MNIKDEIIRRLEKEFDVTLLNVKDESHKHEGHAGYRPGGQTHFRIELISSDFKGMSHIKKQRMIYHILDDLMKTKIHALSMKLNDH